LNVTLGAENNFETSLHTHNGLFIYFIGLQMVYLAQGHYIARMNVTRPNVACPNVAILNVAQLNVARLNVAPG
jgi:hypothetical protein